MKCSRISTKFLGSIVLYKVTVSLLIYSLEDLFIDVNEVLKSVYYYVSLLLRPWRFAFYISVLLCRMDICLQGLCSLVELISLSLYGVLLNLFLQPLF